MLARTWRKTIHCSPLTLYYMRVPPLPFPSANTSTGLKNPALIFQKLVTDYVCVTVPNLARQTVEIDLVFILVWLNDDLTQ